MLLRIFEFVLDALKHRVIPSTPKRAEQHVYEITPFGRWLAYQEHGIPKRQWREAHEWLRVACKAANEAARGLGPPTSGDNAGTVKRLTPEELEDRRKGRRKRRRGD